MGRNKIKIELLEDPKDRKSTYAKRVVGLKRKAEQLAVLCGNDVALVAFPPTGNSVVHQYCNRNWNDVINRLSEMGLQGGQEGVERGEYSGARRDGSNLENNRVVPNHPANRDSKFEYPTHKNQLNFRLPSLDEVRNLATMQYIRMELRNYMHKLDHGILEHEFMPQHRQYLRQEAPMAGAIHPRQDSMYARNFTPPTCQSNSNNQFIAQAQVPQTTADIHQYVAHNRWVENQHDFPNPQQLHFNPSTGLTGSTGQGNANNRFNLHAQFPQTTENTHQYVGCSHWVENQHDFQSHFN